MTDTTRRADAKYDERLKLLLAVADKLFNGDAPRQVGTLIIAFDAADPKHCHFNAVGLDDASITTMCRNVIDGLKERAPAAEQKTGTA